MGNTTIIEFNHDQWSEIFEHQVDFMEQLLQQFQSFEYTGKQISGGKVLAGFHRSGKVYEDWCKFKKKMKW